MKIVKLLTGLAFILFASMMVATVFSIAIIYPLIGLSILSIIPGLPAGALGISIFQAPGGIGAAFSFNLNFLPAFLTWNNVVPLTSLRIATKEFGVIHDFNAAAIAAMNGYMVTGVLPANNILLRVATGDIKNQDVTVSGVTSAAGAISFFISSDNALGIARPLTSKSAQILANAITRFEKFTALFIPALAATTDRVEVQFASGHKQVFELQELLALSVLFQNVPGVIINNINSYIDYVDVRCAAATPAYLLAVVL